MEPPRLQLQMGAMQVPLAARVLGAIVAYGRYAVLVFLADRVRSGPHAAKG